MVDLYTRGVARAAIDEGARAGAVFEASELDCERRARAVVSGVAPRGAVQVSCHEVNGSMRARATVALAGWLPGIPTWTFVLDGVVVKERP